MGVRGGLGLCHDGILSLAHRPEPTKEAVMKGGRDELYGQRLELHSFRLDVLEDLK